MRNTCFEILLTYLLICLYSCSIADTHENIQVSPKFASLNIDTTIVVKNISEIAKEIKYVPLQSSNANLIGAVDKVDYFSNMLFVLDKKISKALYVFDTSGKLLYKKKVNEGELDRIASISDFSIDKKNKTLWLYSSGERQILKFTLPEGGYLKRLKVNGYFSDISSVDSGRFVLLRDGLTKYADKYNNERVCLFDSNGNVIKSWLDQPLNHQVSAGMIIKDQSPINDNHLLICRMFDDTIYSINNSRLEAEYKLPLHSDISSIQDERSMLLFIKDYPTSFVTGRNIFNTQRYLALYVKRGDIVCLLLYDKTQKSGSIFKALINDFDNISLPMVDYMDDSCFISLADPSQLQQQYHFVSNSPNFTTKYSQLIKLNDVITRRSNPVVIFGKLK